MAYIGQSPSIGNFQVCDAISVVNGQAAYTMQVSSVNVVPETANHMIVSLNGVIQAPGSSYTVSGSTITFASNLVTGDVIDFIHILGSVLDLGVPSDSTVSLAKLTATGTKDATTFLRGDNTFSAPSADMVLLATTDVDSAVSAVSFDGYFSSTYKNYKLIVSNTIGATNGAYLKIRYRRSNADVTASNYDTVMTHSDSATTSNQAARVFAAFENNGSSAQTFTHNEALSNNTAYPINMVWDIFSPLDTDNYKVMMMHGYARNSSSNNHVITQTMTILEDATTALSGISFFFSSGNIAKGNYKLYGIK